ncbi:MAG TPA: hypothetical protein VGO58_10370 [Chitinophagaceae bacterium]|nr:hypothetical protein [Chitinophagaceae bacterium]
METGRYWVVMRSGRKFMVEEWGNNYVQWGDIDPATKKLNKVKVKDSDLINETNTLIKKENGFKNICFLSPGHQHWDISTCLIVQVWSRSRTNMCGTKSRS